MQVANKSGSNGAPFPGDDNKGSNMNLHLWLLLLLGTVATAICRSAHAATPTVFAPGVISGPRDDGSPAFAPDRKTVFFRRGAEGKWTLMESRRADGQWSAPRTVPFSGRWHDEDPTMAPDGSFLLFASHRPTTADGKPLDAVANGKVYTGWRIQLPSARRLKDRSNTYRGVL